MWWWPLTWLAAAPGTVFAWEETTFGWFNGAPEWLFPLLWLPMQAGGLAGVAVLATLALVLRSRPMSLTYAAASLVAWLTAVIVKEVVERGRPLAAGLDAVIRGSDSSGFGFISGHTTVAFAGATVVLAFWGARAGAVAYVLATAVGIARMYVGAHLPLDVIGGAAAGTVIGSLVTLLETRVVNGTSRARTADP